MDDVLSRWTDAIVEISLERKQNIFEHDEEIEDDTLDVNHHKFLPPYNLEHIFSTNFLNDTSHRTTFTPPTAERELRLIGVDQLIRECFFFNVR